MCFIGPSGCGKTTLLNMSAGLLAAATGRVDYRGEKMKASTPTSASSRSMTIFCRGGPSRRTSAIALEIQKVPRQERRRRVAEVIELVGLSEFAQRFPSQLSGGMQKRASLARGLVYGPSTLLMDEPFGALDAQLRLNMQNELLHLVAGPQDHHLRHPRPRRSDPARGPDRRVRHAPGRVIHVEDVPLARPRDLAELRLDHTYGEIWERL